MQKLYKNKTSSKWIKWMQGKDFYSKSYYRFSSLNVHIIQILFYKIFFSSFVALFGSLMRLAAKQHPFPWQMFLSHYYYYLFYFVVLVSGIQNSDIVCVDFLSVFLIVSHNNHGHSHKNTLTLARTRAATKKTLKMAKRFLQENISCQVLKSFIHSG